MGFLHDRVLFVKIQGRETGSQVPDPGDDGRIKPHTPVAQPERKPPTLKEIHAHIAMNDFIVPGVAGFILATGLRSDPEKTQRTVSVIIPFTANVNAPTEKGCI